MPSVENDPLGLSRQQRALSDVNERVESSGVGALIPQDALESLVSIESALSEMNFQRYIDASIRAALLRADEEWFQANVVGNGTGEPRGILNDTEVFPHGRS